MKEKIFLVLYSILVMLSTYWAYANGAPNEIIKNVFLFGVVFGALIKWGYFLFEKKHPFISRHDFEIWKKSDWNKKGLAVGICIFLIIGLFLFAEKIYEFYF